MLTAQIIIFLSISWTTLAAVSVTRCITLFISDFQYPAGPSKPYLSAHTNLSGCKGSHNKEHLPSYLVQTQQSLNILIQNICQFQTK